MKRISLAILLLAALLMPALCHALDDAAWAAMKEAAKNRQRRLIYDNDGDDAVIDDDGSEKSLEKFLAKRTSYLAGSQVDTHLRNGDSYMNMPFIHPKHPMELAAGQEYPIILEFGDDTAALRQEGCTFDVTALLAGRVPEPEKLVLACNGLEWRYAGMDGECFTYEVPAGSLRPGQNTVTIRYTGTPGAASDEQVIMAGDVLLSGANQPPWRRLFNGCQGGTAESIVNNAYRLEDNGSGYANLLYPLPAIQDELVIKGSMKLESGGSGEGAVLRIADGRHVETLLFTPGQIALKEAGSAVAFQTGDAFHDYEVRVTAEQMILQADGKTLLEAPMVTPVTDARAMLKGAVLHMANAATRSLLVGSLDDAGSGVSLWRNLRINRQNGRTFLTDFAVETNICRPVAMRTVQQWQHTQENGAPFFPSMTIPAGTPRP